MNYLRFVLGCWFPGVQSGVHITSLERIAVLAAPQVVDKVGAPHTDLGVDCGRHKGLDLDGTQTAQGVRLVVVIVKVLKALLQLFDLI